MDSNQYYVYIMANKPHGTIYTGVTRDLIRQVYEHKNGLAKGFTKKHDLHRLVYYEIHISITEAIAREKQIKKWLRKWKIGLIEQNNLKWEDLYDDLV